LPYNSVVLIEAGGSIVFHSPFVSFVHFKIIFNGVHEFTAKGGSVVAMTKEKDNPEYFLVFLNANILTPCFCNPPQKFCLIRISHYFR